MRVTLACLIYVYFGSLRGADIENYFSSSVLETERTLVLAEKGSEDSEVELLTAGEKFRILATMNPGGDFGKKEVTCSVVTAGGGVTVFSGPYSLGCTNRILAVRKGCPVHSGCNQWLL